MKRFILIAACAVAALLQGTLASAQYIHSYIGPDGNKTITVSSGPYAGTYSQSPLETDGSELRLMADPISPLSDADLKAILSPEDFAAYRRAHKACEAGFVLDKVCITGLLSSGLVMIVHGFGVMADMWEPCKGLMWGCAGVAAAGLTAELIAIPLEVSGSRTVKRIASEYNDNLRKTASASVGLGATGNGVGLALKF